MCARRLQVHHSRLLGLLLLTAAAACQRDRAEQPSATPLQAEVIADGDYLDSPRRVAVIGGRLVVLDRSAPMIHVFRLPEGERVGSFGRKGQGPGEFGAADEIQASPAAPDAFWVFDGNLSRVTRLRFDGAGPVPGVDEVVNLHGEGGLHFQAVWISDSALAATGIYPGHPQSRLLRLDREGRALGGIGTLPQHPNGAGIPPTVLHHAYEGRMAVRPDRSLLVFGTRHADALEFYRPDGTLVRKVTGPTGFLPVFDTNARAEGVSMATGDDLRVGYLDLAATQDHLFALFSGDTRGEARARTYFGKEVHVFDWSGERITTLALDERAIAIAVDPVEGRLYAVRHDPIPNVARYRLPALPKRD